MNILFKKSVTLTQSAIGRLKNIINEKNIKFRIYIYGGGCSGFKYGFTLDKKQNNDDVYLTQDGIIILIDYMSFQYLIGSYIDYKEELSSSKFVVINPNAKNTCSCGYSFSIY